MAMIPPTMKSMARTAPPKWSGQLLRSAGRRRFMALVTWATTAARAIMTMWPVSAG